MHIKEAYERRILQEVHPPKTQTSVATPLDRSQVIGSKHTGQLNYDPSTSFFSNYKKRDSVLQAKQ